ncbi:hypothetical protein D3C85_1564250 [compost metagenome]
MLFQFGLASAPKKVNVTGAVEFVSAALPPSADPEDPASLELEHPARASEPARTRVKSFVVLKFFIFIPLIRLKSFFM